MNEWKKRNDLHAMNHAPQELHGSREYNIYREISNQCCIRCLLCNLTQADESLNRLRVGHHLRNTNWLGSVQRYWTQRFSREKEVRICDWDKKSVPLKAWRNRGRIIPFNLNFDKEFFKFSHFPLEFIVFILLSILILFVWYYFQRETIINSAIFRLEFNESYFLSESDLQKANIAKLRNAQTWSFFFNDWFILLFFLLFFTEIWNKNKLLICSLLFFLLIFFRSTLNYNIKIVYCLLWILYIVIWENQFEFIDAYCAARIDYNLTGLLVKCEERHLTAFTCITIQLQANLVHFQIFDIAKWYWLAFSLISIAKSYIFFLKRGDQYWRCILNY